MIARALVAAALCAPLLTVSAQSDGSWRTIDVSRQLHDSAPQRVKVQFDAGRVDVRGTDARVLYAMHLRYDEERASPLHRYDQEQHSALLGAESRGNAFRTSSSASRTEGHELRLALPTAVPLDLDLELGGTEARLELGGLALQSLRLECGATDATLDFATPNRTHMRELDVGIGAAEFTATHLANANAEQIRVRGGIGTVDLDFAGTWTRDLDVVTRVAIGKLTVRVPDDVGVRVEVKRVAASFDHEGLVKRGDAWFSSNWDSAPHKLRIHAETAFGAIDVVRSTR
ncbi:MAG TPA: LiaF domain-containing protein [Gemmatimonadaceae bacterium]|nr:LiaF domain-containing protein [Gemmatimonadaceae bacterium]